MTYAILDDQNHLVPCDQKLVHCISYIRSTAGAIFGSGKEPKEERIRCDT